MISREKLVIPTYTMDESEKDPIFYDVRNNQNTRGTIYPLPMKDIFTNEKKDVEYDCIRLENDYIRIRVLPELGGRIYEGYDKKAEYNFVYKNNVIKPQLIGLAGAWVSGGIEFNWPQHHRPTTCMKVDSWITENQDGSETAWIGEYEPLFGLKSTSGITIWPDRSYVTVKTRIYNPTRAMQTFHWWANLAVHANKEYQLKFPPDIDYITYHYKDKISEFPIVKGEFARSDFREGTDITWFKNIPSPASFFILNSSYNFMGGYDHGAERGTVHIADHNISVGKKYFTWGNGEFGNQWHKNLTDNDGAYLEIMTGCYTDNQPDFTFLAPDETKTFEQTWYCIENMPDIKNAEKDAAVGFHIADGKLYYDFNVTSLQKSARIIVKIRNKIIVERTVDLSPGIVFSDFIQAEQDFNEKDVILQLINSHGKLLITYEYRKPFFSDKRKPEAHKPARKPTEIDNNDELYAEGLHIEQYRHMTLRAEDYYKEALRRDCGDLRCNNALGMICMKQGRFDDALKYFGNAVQRAIMRNPNPRSGEYYFNYAWALQFNGRIEDAISCYRKAAWNLDYKAAALREAAKLYLRQDNVDDALEIVNEALTCSSESSELLTLLAYILRHTGNSAEAARISNIVLLKDPLDYGALVEEWLSTNNPKLLDRLKEVLTNRVGAWNELIRQYMDRGAYEEMLTLGQYTPDSLMIDYYCAYAAHQLMQKDIKYSEEEKRWLDLAHRSTIDYCYPNNEDDVVVLHYVIQVGAELYKPYYLLALYFYGNDNRQEGARFAQMAVNANPYMREAHRLLAIALMDVFQDKKGALNEIEKSFNIEKTPRGLMELIKYKEINDVPYQELLHQLENNDTLVNKLEDLKLLMIRIALDAGDVEKASILLRSKIYHPYEGGEGQIAKYHRLTFILKGEEAQDAGDFDKAESMYNYALTYPENYNEGRLLTANMASVQWHMARLFKVKGDYGSEYKWYEQALTNKIGYSDGDDLYICMSLRDLGKVEDASILLRSMLHRADQILENIDQMPYFGGFISNLPGEHSIVSANSMRAYPLKFYALLGLGYRQEAEQALEMCKQWHTQKAQIELAIKDFGL